ncbi:leader peptidase (prepilin peptidase)/N-methyltransferase [Kitasatospora gansuensis]|uniref:Leader peptidase (Prepilin peptidase)/N-methyltransferase n=1 Tax=Kitasatospora gansuensis TaxID=258050 RepID=A0A7W7WI64_9ACTN|nr:prepilin peptidase [Kitasatospora gansuensis]MBB4947204.1 leader peptidase (prepilin peptidase)/N-methyltransferase [Kitasatospora gansuensis]
MIAILGGAAVGLALAPGVRRAVGRYAVPYEGEPAARPLSLPVAALVSAATGAAVGAGYGSAGWPVLVWVALLGLVLGLVDASVHRLPDPLTAALAAGAAALLLMTERQSLLRCLLAALALGLGFALLALLAPIGLGDAKLAPSLGALLAVTGWGTVLAGLAYAFLLAGLWAVALLLTRRAGRQDALAFGPFLLLGTLLAVLATG